MSVILNVKIDNSFQELCILQYEQPLIIGRLSQCDLAFPDDLEMSGRHLSLTLNTDMSCGFFDLESTNGTFLNDKQVTEGFLLPSDVLRCGTKEFRIGSASNCDHHGGVVHTHPATSPGQHKAEVSSTISSLAAVPPETSGFTSTSALEIYEKYSLDKEISSAPIEGESPATYAIRLSRSCDQNECLTFLAYALPKRCAVWWLTQSIRASESFKSDSDARMLELAENWVRKPTDEARRQAMQLAEALEMASPAAWAGVSAFWSHGSMGPPDAPTVPPPDDLTGKAVIGGAILASVFKNPEKALNDVDYSPTSQSRFLRGSCRGFSCRLRHVDGSEKPWCLADNEPDVLCRASYCSEEHVFGFLKA